MEENTKQPIETQNIQKPDTYSYKGWLNSDNFMKRVFGIFFYYSLASIIVTVAMFAFILLLTAFVTGSMTESLGKLLNF